MGRERYRPLPLFARGRALRHSGGLPSRRQNRESFHGGQNHQRGRGRHRQRACDGLLPCHRRGCWQSGREVARVDEEDMMRTFEQAWAETFRHAAKHSPYYRETFRGLEGLPRLGELPLVDKEILSGRNEDFLCVPRERIVEMVTTSGTTGTPLLWMLTESDVRRLALNEKQSFECAGLTANDTVLVAVAMDRCFIAGLAYWLGLRELGCSVARVGPSSPLLVLEMIERVKPTAIVAVPSFLRVIAEKAR